MERHPIRVVVADDLRRSRLTVFFRVLLALPHLVWLYLWASVALFLIAPIAWIVTLVRGEPTKGLWDLFAMLVRYSTHVYAFVLLAGNPFPGFAGKAGSYPIDVEIDPPGPQSRWKTAFRGLLVLPALLLAGSLLVIVQIAPVEDEATGEIVYVPVLAGFSLTMAGLAWFVSLVRGRMPQGIRDALAYALRFNAQAWGYLLFLTDRYPSADPVEPAATAPTPRKPVRLTADESLRRSRLTAFFRLPLAFPHIVWLLLWGVAVLLAVAVGWLAALVTGRMPGALFRFVGAFVRYQTHVYAFLYLVGNLFPGFAGKPGTYPIDLEIDPPEPQSRWKTLLRLPLALPALALLSGLNGALILVGVYGWVVSVLLGRMPGGLRNLGAYVLRYSAQTSAYLFLLTDSYPYTGPVDYVEPEPEPEAFPPWPAAPPSLSS